MTAHRDFMGVGAIAGFGDPQAEYQALGTTAGLFDATWCGVVTLTGDDRLKWLQGLVTQDLRPLVAGSSTEAAMLTHKGKMVGDMRIHAFEDRLLVESLRSCHVKLPEELDRYLFAEDVEIEDGGESIRVVGLRGPATAAVLRALAPSQDVERAVTPGACGELDLEGRPVRWAARDDLGGPGLDLFVEAGAYAPIWGRLIVAVEKAGGRPVGLDAIDARRIEAGTPWYGVDTDEDTIPVEAGLEKRAISYDKGCYVGQEVIARIRTRGHVNRHLVRLALDAPAPVTSGTPLTHEGKPVGRITSCVTSPESGRVVALGYLRREHLAAGARFALGGEGAGTAAVVGL